VCDFVAGGAIIVILNQAVNVEGIDFFGATLSNIPDTSDGKWGTNISGPLEDSWLMLTERSIDCSRTIVRQLGCLNNVLRNAQCIASGAIFSLDDYGKD
jgi:hypothetical protein